VATEHQPAAPAVEPVATPAGPGPAGAGPVAFPGAARRGGFDPAMRARMVLALQRSHGNAYVQGLARGAMVQRAEPPELGSGNYEIPEGIDQEYKVSAELEEQLARIARGETTAAEVEAGAAQGGTEAAATTDAGSVLAAYAPAFIGIAGAAITIAATLATLSEADEEKQVGDAIVAATDGYCAGFMSGLGWGGSGGDPKWFADGQQKGAAAKAAFVARVKADPKLQALDIGPDEVMLAVADQKAAFHRELYARVKPKIADAYISKWKAGLGWATKTFTNEETSGERNIRTRAGMPAQ
jgi:hypothetical protein